ncbi:hypothetical protein [Nonomuraea dietziae]|uniref:hypothetical protein n=1 Tax=Nonomuraea dietziae TaxID=65515 RepID=UPI0033CEA070
MTALTKTEHAIRQLAQDEGTPVARAPMREAFYRNDILPLRYQVSMVAPDEISRLADEAYAQLRDIRDEMIHREIPGVSDSRSPEWLALHDPYVKAINTLRVAMRSDIR